MTRSTTTRGFTIEAARATPTAAINPTEIGKVVGAIIRLDGRASSSADGEALTYAWSFSETPLGSTVSELRDVEGDGSVVTFIPDLTGQYVVSLVVSTQYRSSEAVEAVVEATSVLLPLLSRTTPDGSLMLQAISSFWNMVENVGALKEIWTGYMQVVASELLSLLQVDANKSIATIQEVSQRRWLRYAPALALDSSRCTGVFGYSQGGGGAYTLSGATSLVGIIVSSHEVVLLDGIPESAAAGSALTVYTSHTLPGNTGTYTINRLNSDGSGYLVSPSVPFPAPEAERIRAASTLVVFSGERHVYDLDLLVDFNALGVVAGDVLRIESGGGSGYYRITAVGTSGGLVNNRTLQLDRAPAVTGSNRSYSIFNSVRISAAKDAVAATRTVFLPATEADLSYFSPKTLSGKGTVSGAFEIVVEARHVFPALVGEKLTIASGSYSGRSFTITGLNAAGTGYLVGSSLSPSLFSQEVVYRLQSPVGISDRLLVLEGEAYEIYSAEYDSGTDPEDGGRGAAWIVTLRQERAPTGREGLEWRIASSLRTTEYDDVESQGITAGDLLIIEVVRKDSQLVGELPCLVLGAAGNKIAFDFGSSADHSGLSDAEILALADALKIPRVYEEPSGDVVVSLIAEEIQALLRSTGFELTYGNLPITQTTGLDLKTYTVTVRVGRLVRNCRIPVDETLLSVPSLFEYIDTPQVGESSGTYLLLGKDGVSIELKRAPLELVENRDYTISSEASTTGANLETSAGSPLMKIPGGDLIDRDLRVGDYVEITSGLDAQRYYVRSVRDNETVDALTAEGAAPRYDATGLSYILRRRTAGNFLRFVDGMFTAASPAPDEFWGQLSLFDNSQAIEDNFGVLVGVTRAQLDEYGSSQVSYLGVVRALMLAWTGGPTMKNLTVGVHTLMGLPVTEVAGQVIDVDLDYDAANGRGRILIEDLDPSGAGTGLTRSYFFQQDTTGGLGTFQGIAVNPLTGTSYGVFDVVPALSVLSRGILVSDYISDPTWWQSGSSSGADELQKFHTWQVLVDSSQVDSRDMQLISDFCRGIRPIYTSPKIVLVLYLYDEITVEDRLGLEGAIFFSDDFSLGVAATHMTDSYNGSSLAQRMLDLGSFGTRTLFEGDDLSTSAGSGVVTSSRGGFAGSCDADPLGHAPGEPVGVLSGVNRHFEGQVYYRGTPLVRAGDILFIRDGVNRGRYAVSSVDSDTQLTVAELPGYPPLSRPSTEMEEETGQVFQIQRLDTPALCSGTASVVDTSEGEPHSTIEDASGNFRWNGVAVGDYLVVETGDDYGVHEVLEVGVWEDGRRVDLDTKLVVRGTLLEADPFSYSILRDGLRTNPLCEMEDVSLSNGSAVIASASSTFLLEHLLPGDEVELLSGALAGQSFRILDVLSDSTLALDHEFGADESGILARVVRPSLFENDDPRDEDWELERLCLHDEVVWTVIDPLSQISEAVEDLVLLNNVSDPDPGNWTATATSGTDLEVDLGILPGDRLLISNECENSGSRTVAAVSGHSVTICGLWKENESPAAGEFWRALSDGYFEVDGASVVIDVLVTAEGVIFPGDEIEIDAVGTFVISSVSGGEVTLTRDTGVTGSYTGRVLRRAGEGPTHRVELPS